MRLGYVLALILIVGAVFATVVTHDFLVWDDDVFLFRNPLLQPPSWAHLAQVWREPYAHLYIPVSYSIWILLGMVASTTVGGQTLVAPAVFHAASVLIHTLSVLVVFALLRLVLRVGQASRLPGQAGRLTYAHAEDDGLTARAAFIGALLFALHPLQVEAVAWASELKDLLAGFFGLLALYLYLAPTADETSPPPRARTWYLAATMAFTLALLCKPNVAVLPLLAGLLDWYLRRRSLRQSLALLLAWVALAGLLALVTRHVQPPSPDLFVPPLLRPLIMGDALAFYLGKLVWPLRLAADYGRTPQWVLAQPATRFVWLVPAVLLVLSWLVRRRWPTLAVGVWFFCLAPLAALGVVAFDFQQYSTVADHYIYLGLFGPTLIVAWLAHRGPRLPTAAGAALLLGALTALTLLQLMIWSNSTAFWQHTLWVNPRSLVAHNNLAAGYLMAQRPELAEKHLMAAVMLKPGDADALINLGLARVRQRRFQEAIEPLQQGLRSRPGDPKAILLLGMSLVETDRPNEAVPYLLQTLESNPEDATTRFLLARALLKLGRKAEARAHLEALQRDDPGSPQVEELLRQTR